MSRILASRSVRCIVLTFGLLPARDVFAQDLTGCWRGTWDDCRSGHTGPLRATFSNCDDQHYRAVFVGRFFKVIPFRFTTLLDVSGRDEDRLRLAGESRLGLFGTFRYSAEATATNFTAHYSSRRYEGQFLLQR